MNLRLTQIQNIRLVPQYQYAMYRQPAGYPNIREVVTPTPKPGYPYNMAVGVSRASTLLDFPSLEDTGVIISTYV